MKKRLLHIFLFLSCLFASNVEAQTILQVPLNVQEQTNWCWSGVSQSILGYYGTNVSQCTIAEFARTHSVNVNFGTVNCCTNGSQGCNQPNYNWGDPGSIAGILSNWGVPDNHVGAALSLSQVFTEISNNRPFIIRWGWYSGGGHFIIGNGIDQATSTVYTTNPWPGEGKQMHTYSWVVDDGNHQWTHTNTMQNAPTNSVPFVSITSPVTGTSYTAPANITMNANASDTDGSISKVEFYNGTTLLGSDNTSPYSFTWSNVPVGTYSLTAKAYDNLNTVKTSTSVTVAVNYRTNQLPTISITSPTSGTAFTAPASVTIAANASDADGTITKVEFYNGTTLLGSDLTPPYSYTWSGVAIGTYSITAKAYDDSSAVKTSSAVSITVNSATNQLPTVNITSPTNNTTFTAPASVTINATASDADGTISKVEFYNGTTLLNTDNSSPYSYAWSIVAAGTYSLTAKAYDNSGATKTSSTVSITVTSTSTCTAQLWNSSTAYVGGNLVQYAGIKYKANWWTQNQRPDQNNGGAGSGQPWTSLGTCTSKMSAMELEMLNSDPLIYPNPTSTILNINMDEGNIEKVQIIGADGSVVLSTSNNAALNISSLASGLYIIKIQSQEVTLTRKFVKQ